MSRARVLALLALVVALVAPRPAAQEDYEAIDVTVTGVAGSGVYLDHGRESGIERGDTVELTRFDGTLVLATVEAVSRTGCRAELREREILVEPGTTGRVLVPKARLAPPAPAAPAPTGPATPPAESAPPATRAAPDHPPWEAPPEDWNADIPLLAPITALEPEDRDPRIRGRVFTDFEYTHDSGDVESRYLGTYTGLDLRWDNPFGKAGTLDFEGEYYHRTADLEDSDDVSDTTLLLERLSYRWGGIRGQPHGVEVGRFLQNEFPELGILDGAEYGYRFDSGSRVGASVGAMPEPTDELTGGDDLQAAVFYRFVSDERETTSLGAAFQKTWHEGEADRDLFVGSFRFLPSRRWSVFATAWVDYYTADDVIKDEGFELTQLQFNGNYRGDAWGFGVSGSQVRIPELLRTEFPPMSAEEILDSDVKRLGVNGWRQVTARTRLDARADAWEDESDSGGSADLRYRLRDILYDDGEVSFGVFGTQGQFSSGLGVRASATRSTPGGFLRLDYDVTNFQQEDFVGSQEEILHQTLQASYDVTFWRHWDLSLYARDQLRGDQNALTVGLTLQRRF